MLRPGGCVVWPPARESRPSVPEDLESILVSVPQVHCLSQSIDFKVNCAQHPFPLNISYSQLYGTVLVVTCRTEPTCSVSNALKVAFALSTIVDATVISQSLHARERP